MAITAIKTGAALPIKPSDTGKPPAADIRRIVKKIPDELKTVSFVPHIQTPFYTTKEVKEDPVMVYDDESCLLK
jgi:hypothetical protein